MPQTNSRALKIIGYALISLSLALPGAFYFFFQTFVATESRECWGCAVIMVGLGVAFLLSYAVLAVSTAACGFIFKGLFRYVLLIVAFLELAAVLVPLFFIFGELSKRGHA